MGEKISDIGSFILKRSRITVELNQPSSSGQQRQIHLHSKNFRMELDENEFIELVLAVRLAKEKLKHLKKIP